jgi:ABC-type glycerol-3-phosphate transport system permease component
VLTGSGLSFVRLSINSVIMTAGRTIGEVVFCSLAAYAFTRMFSAFGTFLRRQFVMGLSDELEEAARLDGANHFQIYWHIMLPLARPGLLAQRGTCSTLSRFSIFVRHTRSRCIEKTDS